MLVDNCPCVLSRCKKFLKGVRQPVADVTMHAMSEVTQPADEVIHAQLEHKSMNGLPEYQRVADLVSETLAGKEELMMSMRERVTRMKVEALGMQIHFLSVLFVKGFI